MTRPRDAYQQRISLSRFKFAGLLTPRDTEASNVYALLHDARGPVSICNLIGINSMARDDRSQASTLHRSLARDSHGWSQDALVAGGSGNVPAWVGSVSSFPPSAAVSPVARKDQTDVIHPYSCPHGFFFGSKPCPGVCF